MSAKTEKELHELALWYLEHVDEVSDPAQNMKFMQKAFDVLLWVLAGAVEDIQKLEGRHSSQRSAILLPGMRTGLK